MKNIFTRTLLITCSAILFASCDVNEMNVSVAGEDGIRLTIKAAAQTRTYIGQDGDSVCSFWNKGDVLGVWTGSVNGVSAAFTNESNDGEDAVFTGIVPAFSGSTTLYAVFPQARIVTPTATHPSVQVNFPGTQSPASSASYDPKAEVLVAMPEEIAEGADSSVVAEMKFARLNSAIKVSLTGALPAAVGSDEKVEKFVFLAGESIDLANGKGIAVSGSMDLDENCTPTGNWSAATNFVTVTPTKAFGFDEPIYFTVAPCVLPADTTLAFRAFTSKHVITKLVKLSSDIDLSSGSFVRFSLSMSDAVVDPLPRVISTSNAEGATWAKQADSTYTVTIRGSYQAENITKYDRVSYFFYYKLNGGSQTLAEINYAYTDSKTFSFNITGLKNNDSVSYITVARLGDAAAGNVKTAYSTPLIIDPVTYPVPAIISASTDYATAFKQADGKYTLTIHGSYVGEYLVENSAPCTYWFQGTGVRYNLMNNVKMPSNSGTLEAVVPDLAAGEEIAYKTSIRLTSESEAKTGVSRNLTIGASLVEWDASYGMDSASFYMEDMATPTMEYKNGGNATASFSINSVKVNGVTAPEFLITKFKNTALDELKFTVPVEKYQAGETLYFNMDLFTASASYLTYFSVRSRIGDQAWANTKQLTFETNKEVPVSYPVVFTEDFNEPTEIQIEVYAHQNTNSNFYIGKKVTITETPTGTVL